MIDRREFLKLAGMAGVVVVSGVGCSATDMATSSGAGEFHFVQLSDTHWGFSGDAANPDARGTLPKAVEAVNKLAQQPDFVVFTGDLTHNTEDPKLRRTRLKEFKEIVGELKVTNVRFMPGEHDGSLDKSEAYQELFGATHYTFDHKGVHFIALDNVSDPKGRLGEAQIQWLEADVRRQNLATQIVVLAHRPLFELYPQWDWWTGDGMQAMKILLQHPKVSVFYGHIHREHHFKTEHIEHHAVNSLIFQLPAPGSVPKRAPIPWNASTPYAGLGFRSVATAQGSANPQVKEHGITGVV